MWWEPTNTREKLLSETVAALRGWFLKRLVSDLPVSFGIGTVFVRPSEGLFPLVLLDSDKFHSEAHGPVPLLDGPLKYVSNEANRAMSELREIKSDIPIHCLTISAPRQSHWTPGNLTDYTPIRGSLCCGKTGYIGTAGVTVWDRKTDQPVILTAGHVFPQGVNTEVLLRRRRWNRPTRFGRVSEHVVPSGPTPGWDAAIIEAYEPERLPVHADPNLLRRLDHDTPTTVYGAVSGLVGESALIQGALRVGGGKKYMWENCWLLGPSGVLTNGDSGASVFTSDSGELAGTYVGSSYFKPSKRPFIHFVQDAASLEKAVLQNWSISFRRQ